MNNQEQKMPAEQKQMKGDMNMKEEIAKEGMKQQDMKDQMNM
jgi:hypothetical protein